LFGKVRIESLATYAVVVVRLLFVSLIVGIAMSSNSDNGSQHASGVAKESCSPFVFIAFLGASAIEFIIIFRVAYV
jgi:hypothetical protein